MIAIKDKSPSCRLQNALRFYARFRPEVGLAEGPPVSDETAARCLRLLADGEFEAVATILRGEA